MKSPSLSSPQNLRALITEARLRHWALSTLDSPTETVTPAMLDETLAADKPLLLQTGRASSMIAVELRPQDGCQLEPKDFPPTWSAISPTRALLFFRCPAGGLPCSKGVLGQGVVIHGDGSAVPLTGSCGWGGFLWMPSRSPKHVRLNDLPMFDQLTLHHASRAALEGEYHG